MYHSYRQLKLATLNSSAEKSTNKVYLRIRNKSIDVVKIISGLDYISGAKYNVLLRQGIYH